MPAISERDASALLEFVDEAASAGGLEPFPTVVLARLARLIPSDACVGYQEVDVRGGACRRVARVEVIGGEESTSVAEASHRFCRQNPLRDPIRFAETRVLALSDFFNTQKLARLDFYQEVWRPLAIHDCLRVWLPAPPDRAYVVYVERGRRYTDRDRTMLELLRPYLIRFRSNAALRRQSTGFCGLTEREAEILGWIGRGKTTAQIAAVLHVSPHTVRKHVENILEKLGVTTRAAAVARVAEMQNGYHRPAAL